MIGILDMNILKSWQKYKVGLQNVHFMCGKKPPKVYN